MRASSVSPEDDRPWGPLEIKPARGNKVAGLAVGRRVLSLLVIALPDRKLRLISI